MFSVESWCGRDSERRPVPKEKAESDVMRGLQPSLRGQTVALRPPENMLTWNPRDKTEGETRVGHHFHWMTMPR